MLRDLSEYQQQVVANARENELWQILVELLEAERNELRDDMRDSPKLCDEDLTKDLRLLLGRETCLTWVLSLPSEAQGLAYPQQKRERT